jgi:hypothetical protein
MGRENRFTLLLSKWGSISSDPQSEMQLIAQQARAKRCVKCCCFLECMMLTCPSYSKTCLSKIALHSCHTTFPSDLLAGVRVLSIVILHDFFFVLIVFFFFSSSSSSSFYPPKLNSEYYWQGSDRIHCACWFLYVSTIL